MIKTPKLYWVDIGLLRRLSGQRGEITGEIYETMVVDEIFKWIKTAQRNVEMFFYRTRSGPKFLLFTIDEASFVISLSEGGVNSFCLNRVFKMFFNSLGLN